MLKSSHTNDQQNQSDQKWRVVAVAILLCISGALAAVVFLEGWNFDGHPHCYLYSALYKYHTGLFNEFSLEKVFFSPPSHNCHYSLIYIFSNTLGKIGEPTPPWFHLTGVILFTIVFFVSYIILPHPSHPRDRLITAMMIASMPVVLMQARSINDHFLHMIIVLAGAGFLIKSNFGMQLRKAWPFYLLPALDLANSFMVTYTIATMLSLVGMYLFLLYWGWRRLGVWRVAKRELSRLAFCVAALAVVMVWRFSLADFNIIFDYYFSEAASNIEATPFNPFYYLHQLVFVLCGVVVSVFALCGVLKKYRAPFSGLYLCWLLVPLIAFTLSPKKETWYIWSAVPALGLLAAGSALRILSSYKNILLAGLCLLITVQLVRPGLQAIYPPSFDGDTPDVSREEQSLSKFINDEKNPIEPEHHEERARRILNMAKQECGSLENRQFIFLHNPPIWSAILYGTHFAALKLDQRPDYNIVFAEPLPISASAVVVEIKLPLLHQNAPFVSAHDLQAMQVVMPFWEDVYSKLPLQAQTEDLTVYCVPDTEAGLRSAE